jgi:WD repeat-containing protein 89
LFGLQPSKAGTQFGLVAKVSAIGTLGIVQVLQQSRTLGALNDASKEKDLSFSWMLRNSKGQAPTMMKELRITPSRTVVTSFQPKVTSRNHNNHENSSVADFYEEGDWVVCVTSGHSHWTSCALSNGEIQVYDQARMHLMQTYRVGNNSNSRNSIMITDLVGDTCSSNPSTLAATDTSGAITIFDIRQPATFACQFHMPRLEEQALSVSLGYDGTLAAVGSNKAKVHFFDVRQATTQQRQQQQQEHLGNSSTSLLGTYHQSHTKEVTQVRFQPLHTASFGSTTTTSTTSTMLVSAGEDGLACVFDTSCPTEDAALKNILSVQAPIRQVGFFGPQSEGIYCLTGSESLKLYHIENPQCQHDYGMHFRQQLGQCLNPGLPAAVSSPSSSSLAYLVNCQWDVQRQELLLLGGTSEGDAAVFSVKGNDVAPKHWLGGGHRGVIRAWSCCSTNFFFTVGEDARLCEWNRLGRQLHAAPSRTTTSTTAINYDHFSPPTTNNMGATHSESATTASSTSPWKQRPSLSATAIMTSGRGSALRRHRNRTSASPY